MAPPIRSRGATFIAFFWIFPLAVFSYFSFVRPWPVADQALAHLGAGPKLVVAMSAGGVYQSRSYVVLRPATGTLNVYEVTEDHRGVRVKAIPFGLFIVGSLYLAWIGASLWYWWRSRAVARK
jgi:hypothetical protein